MDTITPTQNRIPELLAPAGNMECLYAALNAGADAVYLAGQKFGARAYAGNFSEEELVKALDLCHAHGKKVYLTLNTLLNQSEIGEVIPYLTPFYEAGLDGIILQDFGVFGLVKDHFPGIEIHISTQMTVTGNYGRDLAAHLGAVRVVPARECTLQEMKELSTSDTEIESFIHGAMCYCYSGQCLMSSMIGGRSGNRGRCAQPCRLPYTYGSSHGESYLLSLKDMNTLHLIPQLMVSGIASFKIEGRMKSPEYVAGVTHIYRKYMDLYLELKRKKKEAEFSVDPKDEELLSTLYVRTQTGDGYYQKRYGKQMLTLTSPAYKETPEKLRNTLYEKYVKEPEKLPLSMTLECKLGSEFLMTVTVDHDTCRVKGSIVEKATGKGCDATPQEIATELKKKAGALGNTPFRLDSFECLADPGIYVSPSEIKELRRSVIRKLCLIRRSARSIKVAGALSFEEKPDSSDEGSGSVLNTTLTVRIDSVEQLEALSDSDIVPERIYLEPGLYQDLKANAMLSVLAQKGCGIWLTLPKILRNYDEKELADLKELYHRSRKDPAMKIRGFLCASIDSLSYCISSGIPAFGDHSLYQWNSEAVSFLKPYLEGFTIPLELQSSEIRDLCNALCHAQDEKMPLSCEMVVYGRAPLMVTANCLNLTTDQCRKKKGTYSPETPVSYERLTDRKNAGFPVRIDCGHCINTIYNSLPTSLLSEIPYLYEDGIRFYRLEFTTETKEECRQILKRFADALKTPGQKAGKLDMTTTKGHFRRGVE